MIKVKVRTSLQVKVDAELWQWRRRALVLISRDARILSYNEKLVYFVVYSLYTLTVLYISISISTYAAIVLLTTSVIQCDLKKYTR